MKNIETFNDEDSNIWSAIELFDFDGYRTNSELRLALYKKLITSLGFCFVCRFYNKSESFCELLESRLGRTDRCCNFERVEKDEATAFDIMVEPFVEEQKRAADAVKINKYTHWSNKAGSGKTKEDPHTGYDGTSTQEETEE